MMLIHVKKILSGVLVLVFLTAMLAACSGEAGQSGTDSIGGPSSEVDPGEESAAPEGNDGELNYQGTISIYAQQYTPAEPTEAQPYPPTKFKDVAQKYEKLHPGITIDFLPQVETGTEYNAWLKTKISGGQAPDIFWAQYFELNSGLIPEGSYYQLNEFLERPNKYVEGNERWLDLFYEGLVQQTAGPNGELNNIDADYVGTAVYYNVEIFKEAGIDFEIKNWSDYTKACDLLLEAGGVPWAFNFGSNEEATDRVAWFARLFGTNLYYNDWENLAVISGKDAIALSPTEVALGVKNGYFTDHDPRWMAWWPVLKEHVEKYMPRDAISAATTGQVILNMFLNKQIAMFWSGSWAPNDFKNANCGFEYASFAFPIPDAESMTDATEYDSSAAVGGPSGAFQYAVSTEKANNSMNTGKLEACLDFLMFVTTPENVEAIVNEVGSFVPTIKGAKPSEANAGISKLLELEEPKLIDIGLLSLGTEAVETYYREFQSYLQGNQTLEEAAAKIMPVFDRAADDLLSKSDTDITPYLKNN